MPARRRLLGASGAQGYRPGGRGPGSPASAWEVCWCLRPADHAVSPRREHGRRARHLVRRAFESGGAPGERRLGVSRGPGRTRVNAVILHYSLFGMARNRLDEGFLRYLKETGAYKVAFFQDEYFACQRRFAFLNETRSTACTPAVSPQFIGRSGAGTPRARERVDLPGYVSDHLAGGRRAVR